MRAFWAEGLELLRREWEEVALDKDVIPLVVDLDRYSEVADKGLLHILAARDEGRLVGYYVAFIMVHPHYRSSGLMAVTDVYYLLPEYRRGQWGVLLFTEAERTLRDKGVRKVYLSCKIHQDHTQLFELLGWRKSDYMFIKLLN